MASVDRILTLFVVLIVLLATLATSTPISDIDKRAFVQIISLSQSDVWTIHSTQTIAQCHAKLQLTYKLLISFLNITINRVFAFV